MKGLMYELMVVFIGLAFVAFLFTAFNEAWQGGLYSYALTNVRVNSTNTVDSTVNHNLDLVNTIFTYYPVIIVFLAIVFILVIAQRRDL